MAAVLPNADRDRLSVLVHAPLGHDAEVLRSRLGEAGFDARACPDIEALCDQIDRGGGLAIVAEESLTDSAVSRLRATLERQPEWAEFPLIVMLAAGPKESGAWRVLQIIEGWALATLLERPVRFATLLSAVRVGLRSRRRQYQVRDELAARERAEDAARISEAELRRQLAEIEAIYASAHVGLCVFDRELRFLRINDQMAAINGVPADEHLGRTVREVVPELAEEAEQTLHYVLATGKPVRGLELTGQTPAQPSVERTWIEHWEPLRDEQGEIVAVNVVAQEITRRKRAEETLAQLNATLEHQVAERTALAERRAARLRALAAELSEAEHRERTRLAKLLHDELQQLLLAVKMRLPAVAKRQGEEQQHGIQELDGLLTDCLNTSRNLTQELSPPVLQRGTLGEALEWLGGWFWEKHEFDVAIDAAEDLPSVPEHYRVFLFHAARELLFNVVKHAGVREARLEAKWCDGRLEMLVEDEGEGFDPQAVWEGLERPESFGLFHIQERVQALDGRLEIESVPGDGARTRLLLPLAKADSPPVEESPSNGELSATTAEFAAHGDGESEDRIVRLLVVDDHKVVREGVVGLLDREADFEVVGQASNGQEAAAQAAALQPDVVVMDVDMPDISGVEATGRIKRQQPKTVVVGLSLHKDPAVERAMREAGAADYLPKEHSAEELVGTIRRVWAER